MAARTLPQLVCNRSSLHGWGVYATGPITKNTRIVDYAGQLVRNRVADAPLSA